MCEKYLKLLFIDKNGDNSHLLPEKSEISYFLSKETNLTNTLFGPFYTVIETFEDRSWVGYFSTQ